jgi:predicted nucleotidyltransferase
MTEAGEIAHLVSSLSAIQHLLARFGDRGMVIGGVAASLLGKPRLTRDVDVVLLLDIEDLPELMRAAADEGIQPRIAEAEGFARQSRVVLLSHAESNINVDISLGVLPFEVEAVERSNVHHIGSIAIRLPTPEDLIVLKAVAHRPRDMQDIYDLIQTNPQIDREHIKIWVSEFAELLERPELWEDIAKWL